MSEHVTIEELAQAADILRRWEADMAGLNTTWTVVPTAQRGKPRQAGFVRLAYKKVALSVLVTQLLTRDEIEVAQR